VGRKRGEIGVGLGTKLGWPERNSTIAALVAFIGVTAAYIGVRGTQRINVLIKEQDHLDLQSFCEKADRAEQWLEKISTEIEDWRSRRKGVEASETRCLSTTGVLYGNRPSWLC
jgi:hypothetical protein